MTERQYPIHLRRIGEPEIADYLESMVIEIDTHEKMFLELCELKRERDALLASVPKWISVEEKLPEYNERVVATNKFGDVIIGKIVSTPKNGVCVCACGEYIDLWVTHWMPLPRLPEVTVDALD